MKPKRSNPYARMFRGFFLAPAIVVSFLAPGAATAADLTWDANGAAADVTNGAGQWDKTNLNWWNGTTNVAWTDGNTAVIGGNSPAGPGGVISFVDGVDISAFGLVVNDNGDTTNHTLAPLPEAFMSFSLGSGGITANDGLTISQRIFLDANQIWARNAGGNGALVITGDIDDALEDRDLELSSALGPTTVGIVLRGSASHFGTTTLKDGWFQVRHDSLGSSDVILDAAIGSNQRLQFVNAAGTGESGSIGNNFILTNGREGAFHIWGGFTTSLFSPISGGNAASVLRKTDSGTLRLEADNTYVGSTIVDAGTLQIGAGTDTGSITTSSSLTINGSGVLSIERSGEVDLSDLLPSAITFGAAGSRLNIQGPDQASTVIIDRDLGSDTTLGQFRVTRGTATLANGTDLIFNSVSVGHTTLASGNIGTLNVGPGSTITLPASGSVLNTGDSSGNAGIINITGGSITSGSNATAAVRIGHWGGTGNELNISGGSLSVPAGRINIGWDGAATMTMSGGTMTALAVSIDGNTNGPASSATLTGGEWLIGANGIGTSGQGTITLDGGKITATADQGWSVPRTILDGGFTANFGAAALINDNSVTTGSGPWDVTAAVDASAKQYNITVNNPAYSGEMSVASGIRVDARQANSLGTAAVTVASGAGVYLSGTGIHQADFVLSGNGWSEGAGQLGALRFQNNTVSGDIEIAAGGARITAHSNSTGLHTGPLTGTGPLEINSSATNNNGTITLNGDGSGHTGVVTVSQGRLNVGGSLGGSVTTVDGSTLGGEGGIAGNVTLGSASGGSLAIDPGSPAALDVGGTVTLTGTNALVFSGPPTSTGPITVFTHNGLTGTLGVNLTLANPGNFRSVVWNDAAGVVSLDIGNKALTWTGAGGSTWDIGVSENWTDGSASAFYWGDGVTFGESASPAVQLSGSLAPASVLVNSGSTNYTITASSGNQLTGTMALLKSGASTLTMVGANAYTGGTTLSKGTIQVRTAGTLGSGQVRLGDDLTGEDDIALYLDTNRVNFGTQVRVSSAALGNVTLGSTANIAGTGDDNQFTNILLERDVIFDANAADRTDFENVTGTGNITVTGSGRAVFPTVNTFVGDVVINSTNVNGLQLGTNSAAFNAIPNASNVTLGETGALSISYTAGGSETIAGLFGTGTVRNNGNNANSIIVGSGGANGDFAGSIINGGTAAFSFTKTGAGTQKLTGAASTYTGVTTINEGVLEVAVMADGGVASSIGQAPVDAAGIVINGSTLRHIGAAASSNRLFTVGTTGASLEASGTGALTMSADTAITLAGTNVARTFSLGGTNTDLNTFAPIITNNGTGLTTVNKKDTGTWRLTGASTYTGPTTITGGRLVLATLADGGTASPTGQSTKVGANLLINGGTLVYSGASLAVDRAFATGTNGGALEIQEAGTTLTMGSAGSAFAFGGTLEKKGPGTLRLVNYSGGSAAAAKDLLISEGVVEFGTSYFNANPLGARTMVIEVVEGGTLRTTTAHALGGDNIDAGNSLGQLRVMGGLVQFNGTQYIPNGLVGDEGRLVMQGGTVAGTADFRAVTQTTVTVLPSDVGSVIQNTGGISLQFGRMIFDVADGEAPVDLSVSSAFSSNNGYTKRGDGFMVASATSTHAGETLIEQGGLSLTGAMRNTSGVVISEGALLQVSGVNPFTSGHAAPETVGHEITVNGGTLRFTDTTASRLGSVNLNSGATWTINRGTGTGAGYDVYMGALSDASEAVVTVGGDSPSIIDGAGFLRLGTNTVFDVEDVDATGDDLLVSIGFRDQTLDQSNAPGGLTKTGGGSMVLSGFSAHTGNTVVAEGTLKLASAGSLRFLPAASGVSNKVTGAGSAEFNGAFEIVRTGADLTIGNSWVLADVASQSFGSGFTVQGFSKSGNLHMLVEGGVQWNFDTDTGILSLSAPSGDTYAGWIDGFFPGETDENIVGPNADPDGDGIPNAVEFVIGGDPKDGNDLDKLPEIALVTQDLGDGMTDYLKFSFRRTTASLGAGVTAAAETDTDLVGPWTPAAGLTGAVVRVNDPDAYEAGVDRVDVYIPRSHSESGKLFGRLRVTVPPVD